MEFIECFFESYNYTISALASIGTVLIFIWAVWVYKLKKRADDSLFALEESKKCCERALTALNNNRSDDQSRVDWGNAETQIDLANDISKNIKEEVHLKAWKSYKKSYIYELNNFFKKIDECFVKKDFVGGSFSVDINHNELLKYYKKRRIDFKSIEKIAKFYLNCDEVEQNGISGILISDGFNELYRLIKYTTLIGDRLLLKDENQELVQDENGEHIEVDKDNIKQYIIEFKSFESNLKDKEYYIEHDILSKKVKVFKRD